jgi:hypothetical protein
MALPIVLFPDCLLFALSEMLVPELTKKQGPAGRHWPGTCGRSGEKLSLSCAVAAFMFVFADKLGQVVYHSAEAGRYIRLSPRSYP